MTLVARPLEMKREPSPLALVVRVAGIAALAAADRDAGRAQNGLSDARSGPDRAAQPARKDARTLAPKPRATWRNKEPTTWSQQQSKGRRLRQRGFQIWFAHRVSNFFHYVDDVSDRDAVLIGDLIARHTAH